jgi:hypothetical protein
VQFGLIESYKLWEKYKHQLRARDKYEELLKNIKCAPLGDKPRPAVKFDMGLANLRGNLHIELAAIWAHMI